MYRKTLIALGCVMISLPAFAQSPDSYGSNRNQPNPGPQRQTGRPNPGPQTERIPNLNPRAQAEQFEQRRQQQRGSDNRTSAERYGWGPNPKGPPSPYGKAEKEYGKVEKRLKCSHPTYKDRVVGWQQCW